MFYLLTVSISAALTLLTPALISCGGQSRRPPPTVVNSNPGVQRAAAAGDTPTRLGMTIKPTDVVWDPKKALRVEVSFHNEGERDVFINLTSAYRFYGFLEDSEGHVFGIEWRPAGAKKDIKRSDYTKLEPGGTHTISINSHRIRSETANKIIPWRAHKAGRYALWVQYASGSKTYFMQGQWEGTMRSNKIEIEVR